MDEIDLTQNSASAPVLRMHAQQNKRTARLQQRALYTQAAQHNFLPTFYALFYSTTIETQKFYFQQNT
jgi:hypothetical protein